MQPYSLSGDVLTTWTTQAVLIAPIIIGIVQALKVTKLPDRYAPIMSIAVGVMIAFMTGRGDFWGDSALSGVIYGLSASGLYSGAKSFMTKEK